MGECKFKRIHGKLEDFGLKSVYTVDLLNKYMKIYEYKRSRSLFDL